MTLSIFCCAVPLIKPCEASCINTGQIEAGNLEIKMSTGGSYRIDEELIANGSFTLCCDEFSGMGLLSSPQISIEAKKLTFTGTINCSNRCIIITKSPIDENMFKRTGEGQFIFIVDKNLQ